MIGIAVELELADFINAGVRSIQLGRIKEVAAQFKVTAQDPNGLGFVGRAVSVGHSHTAQPER